MANPTQAFLLNLNLMAPNEKELVQKARSNPAEFGALYRQYLTPVYRYLYSKTGCQPEAEDLTSQVFLAALEGLPRYKDTDRFSAWLFSIARNKAADYFRRRPKQISLENPIHDQDEAAGFVLEEKIPAAGQEPDDSLLVQIIQQDEMKLLKRLVLDLPEDERELLNLRFAARLSFDEMASVLKRKSSAVKMSLYRLLNRLEAQLEANHE